MTKIIPKVSKRALIFLAGLIWCFAGYNILKIGFPYMIHNWNTPLLSMVTSVIVFVLFFKFIFFRLVGKHNKRIKSYTDEKIMFYKFFDGKSYLIMAFMMTFGIVLRNSGLLPKICIGTLYVGLGSALAGAGIGFLVHFFKDAY